MRLELGAQDKLEMPSLGGETTCRCVKVSLAIRKKDVRHARENVRKKRGAHVDGQLNLMALFRSPSIVVSSCMRVGFPSHESRDETHAHERSDPKPSPTIRSSIRARQTVPRKKKNAKDRHETALRSSDAFRKQNLPLGRVRTPPCLRSDCERVWTFQTPT